MVAHITALGCHNKEAQSFGYGNSFSECKKQEIIEKIKNNSILKGITISGGEPLCRENIKEVCNFIKDVKKVKKDFNVWCYSGYTLDELVKREDEDTMECLNEIDVLVDGRFKQDLKDPTLKFRGSSNQRILDLKQSLKAHQCIEMKI